MSRRSLHRRRPFAPKQTPISEAGVKADDGKWYVTMPGGDVIGCDIDARTGCLSLTFFRSLMSLRKHEKDDA